MFKIGKIGDRVRTKGYIGSNYGINNNTVCYTGIIIGISKNTVLVKFDDWGKFHMKYLVVWKDQILSMTILCA